MKLTKKEIDDRHSLLALLHSYGFIGFMHTTEYRNLLGILKSRAIIPRYSLSKEEFIDVANQDVLLHTNIDITQTTRFYYKEKTPTNFKANYTNPVIIIVNELIIFDPKAIFCSGNAGSDFTVKTKIAEEALKFNWELIFERGIHSESKCEITDQIKKRSIITNHRNAEFLYDGKVATDKITKIIFKKENASTEFENLIHSDCDIQIKPEYFRKD